MPRFANNCKFRVSPIPKTNFKERIRAIISNCELADARKSVNQVSKEENKQGKITNLILKKNRIKLPYLGRDKFIELTRIGLGYEQGSFFIRDFNNIENIIQLLSEILNEKIVFTQTCVICGKEFLCTECKYINTCSTRDLPLHCLCENCSQKNNLYKRYVEKNKISSKVKR